MRVLKNINSFSKVLPIQKYSIVRPNLKGDSNYKPLLLTFDDGPNNIDNVSLDLLTVLKKHNVKVVFCLIGKNVKEYPHIVKQIYMDGHIIANHGHAGDPFIFKRMKNISGDIDACNNAICEAIEDHSHEIEYFRPGYGVYFKKHQPLWESKNMCILPVTDFFFDHKVKSSGMEKFISNFITTAKKNNGGVYVMHDGRNEHHKISAKLTKVGSEKSLSDYDRRWIPSAVDKIITELKKTDFIFPELDDGLPNKFHPDFKTFLFSE